MKPACIDLRPWAQTHRYRWRWEQSRVGLEEDPFLVEVICQYGLIYPKGKNILLAYANSGIKRKITELGQDIEPHQHDGNNEVFRFPAERLDEVAAILKPRRRRHVVLTDARLESLRKGREALTQSRKS